MVRRRWTPLALALVLGGLAGWGMGASTPVAAQDRGAPLFGPMLQPDTVAPGSFDTERLGGAARWPQDYFETRSGIQTGEPGRTQVRTGVVRLSAYSLACSRPSASPDGLVLTATKCVRPHLSSPLNDSLRAVPLVVEEHRRDRRLPQRYAERVGAITSVTQAARSERRALTIEGAPAQVRRRAVRQVEGRRQRQAEPDQRVPAVSEGDRCEAYTHRRYDDIRLAFLQEEAVRKFGGALVNAAFQGGGVVVGQNPQSVTGEHLFVPDRIRALSRGVRGLLEGPVSSTTPTA